MANEKQSTTFEINVEGNAAAEGKKVADSSRLAAAAIAKYEAEIKALQGNLRRLRGNSEEVQAAKAALKAQIDAARASVSSLTVELQKQGTTFDEASKSARTYRDRIAAVVAGAKKAAEAVGRGASALASPIARAVGKATSPATKAIATAVAPALKKVAAAVAPIAKAISTKLAPVAAGAKRALEPVGRIASRVGAVGGKAFSSLGSALGPVASGALPLLGKGLALAASGAAAAALAVAASAAAAVAGTVAFTKFAFASSDAAAKAQRQRQALLGNAKDAKALGENVYDVAGRTGLATEQVQALGLSLSKTRLSGTAIVNTMNAVAQATNAIDEGAGAKLQEVLTRGARTGRMGLGRLELEGTGIEWEEVAQEYAAGTKKSIGAARQELTLGQASLEKGAEALRRVTEKKFGQLNLEDAFSLENGPKKLMMAMRQLTSGVDLSPITKGLQAAFGQLSPDQPLGKAIQSITKTLGGGIAEVVGKSIPLLLEGFKWLLVGALKVGTAFYEMKKRIADAFSKEGWVGVGKQIVIGLAEGIYSAWKLPLTAAESLAKQIMKTFAGKLEIKSPSRVFKRYGEHTVEGYAEGVQRGTQGANSAVANMVDVPSAGAGKVGGGVQIDKVEVNINGAPTSSASAMSSPEFLSALTHAVRNAVAMRAAT